MLKNEKGKASAFMISLDVKPLYPAKVASKPFLVEFVAQQFQKLDGKKRQHKRTCGTLPQFYRSTFEWSESLLKRVIKINYAVHIHGTWTLCHDPSKTEHLVSLFNTNFFYVKANFTLVELGRSQQYPEEDLDACIKYFYEKAQHCCDPVIEDVLVDVCLHDMIEDYRAYLKNLSFSSFSLLMEAGWVCQENCKI